MGISPVRKEVPGIRYPSRNQKPKWCTLCGVALKKLTVIQLAVYVNEAGLLHILVLDPAVGQCKLSTGHKRRLRDGQFKHKKNK